MDFFHVRHELRCHRKRTLRWTWRRYAADVRGAKEGRRGPSCCGEELLSTGSKFTAVRRTVVSASCCACHDRRYRTLS
jgi:hypothetical protein